MFNACYIVHFSIDRENSAPFVRCLGEIGYDGAYEFISTLAEAVTLLAQVGKVPSVIVVESRIELPVTLELLSWLGSRPLNPVPIVVYSDCTDNTSFDAALRAGAAGYLIKSVDARKMLAAVRRVLEFCDSAEGTNSTA